MEKVKLTIPKVWRSELGLLCGFVFFGVAGIYMSQRFPGSIITGTFLKLDNLQINITLPLYWLAPFFIFLLGILRIYDVQYIIDSRGLEARVGILRLNQRIVRVLYNDIRSAETAQNVLERVLNVGNVEIGTAATAGIEIVFKGISTPQEVQQIIQRERDRALQTGAAG